MQQANVQGFIIAVRYIKEFIRGQLLTQIGHMTVNQSINQSINQSKRNIFYCLIIKIHQFLLQCFNESDHKLSHKFKELLRTPVQIYHLVS